MDESDADKIPLSLKTAVRKARVEQAERSGAVSELRQTEFARLDILYDAFRPILAQVPATVDLFDCGVVPGERPRLFVDMIAFVEMAHDKRTYCFVQETRHGRVTIAESDRVDPIVEAMTDYVARRLVERESALAADLASRYAPGPAQGRAAAKQAAPARAKSRFRSAMESTLLFTIELLGAIVLFILLMGAVYLAWRFGESWWLSHYAQR